MNCLLKNCVIDETREKLCMHVGKFKIPGNNIRNDFGIELSYCNTTDAWINYFTMR